MSTIIRINAPARTGGYQGGVHITNNGVLIEVAIDDSSTYEIVTSGTGPNPPPPPLPPPDPPPVVPPGTTLAKIAYPMGDVTGVMLDVVGIISAQPVAVRFDIPIDAPNGILALHLVEIGLGRRKLHEVSVSPAIGDWTHPTHNFCSAPSPSFDMYVSNLALLAGRTYYVNVRSSNDGQRSDFRIQLNYYPA
jgi:hypothetical protein